MHNTINHFCSVECLQEFNGRGGVSCVKTYECDKALDKEFYLSSETGLNMFCDEICYRRYIKAVKLALEK